MYLLNILYFFLPLINFLNDINLPQISNNDYIWIFIFYILILFLFSIIYFCIFKFYKKITKYLFIIPLSYFFSFFYRDIFNYLGLIYFILINISIIILYLIFINKKNIYLIRFLYIFFFINFSIFIINFVEFSLKNNDTNFKSNYKIEYNKKSNFSENVYLIILDSMINIKDYNYIFKDNVNIDSLTNNEYIKIENLYSSYNVTYAALTSFLASDYILDETSKYHNYNHFFPNILKTEKRIKLNFLNFINKTDYKLIHFGNRFYPDESSPYSYKITNTKDNFLNKYFNKTFFFLFEKSYFDGIYKKIFHKNFSENIKNKNFDNDDSIENLKLFLRNSDIKFKKTFFLVHHLYPHHPYVYNEKCEKKHLGNYKINYNCTLLKIKDLQNFLRKNDPNATVIFISDHGLKLQVFNDDKNKTTYQVGIKNYQIEKKTKYEFSTFNLFNIPKDYRKFLNKNLDTVNLSRLIISIINQSEPKLEPVKYFLLGYPGEERFGSVKRVYIK